MSNKDCQFNQDSDFDLLQPVISEEENNNLIVNVEDEEIKAAVFDLAPDKAPRPDGFPPYFFQKY